MQSKEKGSLMKMRMKLIDTESFLNMPVSARCLYFEQRGNYAQDDIVILMEKGFGKIVQEGIKLVV